MCAIQRPECKVLYAPAKVAVLYPEANLMIAEQTFAWMGKIFQHRRDDIIILPFLT